jgi:uncharacterized membrane protein
MFSLYVVLKFIHVAAVIFWIGGVAALAIMVVRAGRETNPSTLQGLMGMSVFFGQRVIGPTSGIALLAGIAMVIAAKIGFMTLWVQLGFAGFLVHLILGLTVLRKNGMELGRLAGATSPDSGALAKALQRQKTFALVYVLVMLSVVWAMVAKPA